MYRMMNAEKLVTALRKELGDTQDKVANSASLRGTMNESHHGGHESADTQWRLQQLQTQYDHLQARAAAQDKMHKDSERKVEVSLVYC